MSTWTVEKLLTGLKYIFHRKNFPTRSVLNFQSEQNTFNEEEMFELLKNIYKSDGKYELYGNVEQTFEVLKLIEGLPSLITFSTKSFERGCSIETFSVFAYEDLNKVGYFSRQDILLLFVATSMKFLKESNVNPLVLLFYSRWILSFFNKIQTKLNRCFELIPKTVWNSIEAEIKKMIKPPPRLQNRCITVERFQKLCCYMEQNDEYLLDLPFARLNEIMKIHNITDNQKLYLNMYSSIISIILETEQIYKRNIAVFTPFFDNGIKTEHQVPVVRLFNSSDEKFFFAKELENALEVAMKHRNPKNFFPKGLVQVENEEEKKNGTVYSISYDSFQSITKELGLTEDDLKICDVPLVRDYAYSYLPIPSPYGTLCKPALHVLDELIYFITVVLNSFGVNEDENLLRIVSWVNSLSYLFTEKNNLYFLENWKIDEIMDRARLELKVYFKFWVDTKQIFTTKLEVLTEVRHLTRKNSLDRQVLSDLMDRLITPNSSEYTIKDVYYLFSQSIKLSIMLKNEKMTRFFMNQAHQIKKCGGDENRWCILLLNNKYDPQMLIMDEEETNIETDSIYNVNIPDNLDLELRRIQKANVQLQNTETILKRRLLVFENVNEDNEKLREDVQNKDGQIKQLERKLSMALNTVNHMESSKKDLKNKCKMDDQKILGLQSNMESMNNRYKTSEKLRKDLEETKSVLLVENQQLTMKLDDCEKNQQVREKEIKTILENKDSQIEKLRGIKEYMVKLQTDMNKSENEVNVMQEKFEALNIKYQDSEQHRKNLQDVNIYLTSDNKTLESEKEQLLKRFEDFKRRQKVEVRKKRYYEILHTDFDALTDSIWANLHKLTKKFPNNIAFQDAKKEILSFDVKNYLKIVEGDYWKMRDNRNIQLEELNEEVEIFPTREFMEQYEEWMTKYNLKA